MKKKAVVIICAVLAFLIVAGGVVYALFLPHNLSYDIGSVGNIGSSIEVVEKTEDCVVIRNTENRALKIITFTDTHLDGKNETSEVTVSHLVENITREKPDLVIFGGDNVTSALNSGRAKQLGRIFENLGVYWAGVLGNHEGDNAFSVSRPKMIGIFSSFPHCLMLEGPADIWGDGNYYIKVLNADGSLNEVLFFMDTGDEADAETKAFYGIEPDADINDGVKDSQVQWFRETKKKIAAENADFKSMLFVHIPLPQYKTEAEKGEFISGGKLENVCATGFESGLFDALKETALTQAVFCGHDHLNDFMLELDGVTLGYMQPSGYGSYTAASRLHYEEKDWLQGYMLLTLEKDGSFECEHHRNSEGLK